MLHAHPRPRPSHPLPGFAVQGSGIQDWVFESVFLCAIRGLDRKNNFCISCPRLTIENQHHQLWTSFYSFSRTNQFPCRNFFLLYVRGKLIIPWQHSTSFGNQSHSWDSRSFWVTNRFQHEMLCLKLSLITLCGQHIWKPLTSTPANARTIHRAPNDSHQLQERAGKQYLEDSSEDRLGREEIAVEGQACSAQRRREILHSQTFIYIPKNAAFINIDKRT
jgi:hypothetical protein